MKIALIGAAGVRTPLLIHGLATAGKNLGMQEVALWDIDSERLAVMGRVAAAMANQRGLQAQLTQSANLKEAVEGADYVITSIRVGGIEARIKDEAIALAHGLVGQETVGAGGFACAMRNLGAMLEYAACIEHMAPNATVINFTNPVGIISQGILNHCKVKILGVCDTPLEVFESIAKALERNPFELKFEYVGLNHLGWVRAVRDTKGTDLLPRILSSPELIEKCYRHGLFPADFIQKLGLLPTEYLYFYYFPEVASENTRRSGKSRGQAIAAMNTRLFQNLGRASERDLVNSYEEYLRERNASYFSIEATADKSRKANQELYSEFSGYERIAVLVLEGLQSPTPKIIPLTVRNGKALPDLQENDAVELNCLVSCNGIQVPPVGHAPQTVRALLQQVKEYERLTVQAAVEHSHDAALAALVKNPLVARADVARNILAEYIAAFGTEMKLKAA